MLQGFLLGLLKTYVIETVFSRVKTYLNFSTTNLNDFAYGKQTTIRLGHKNYKPGPIKILEHGNEYPLFNYRISRVFKKRFGDLSLADARLDGFESLADLRHELERCYKTPINNKTKITQIFLRVDS